MEVKSIYRRAADNGLIFGVYLSVLFVMFVLSGKSFLTSLAGLVLLLGIPGVIFVFLRRCFIAEFGKTTISGLWMLGILIFIYASLICGVVTYVYLQYFDPSFIYNQAQAALDIYRSVEEIKGTDLVIGMQRAIEEKLLPTPIQFVFQMIWVTTFFGSLLSLLTALIVRVIPVKNAL